MPIDFKNRLETVEATNKEKFVEEYLKKQKPVIIKNLFQHQAICKWDFNFFKEKLGNQEIGLFDSSEKYKDRSFKHAPIKMRFSEYIDLLHQGPTSLRIFLFDPFKLKPSLKNDFKFPDIGVRILKSLPFMFFGGEGAITRIHKDMDMSNVFLTHLAGKKRVVLFHPKYSRLLYQYPFGVHSSVDIDHPDFKKFPGLKYVKGYECILEKGDTLFMPSGWWHHIEYLNAGFSISHRAPGAIAQGLWQVSVVHYTDELMRKVLGNRWSSYKEKKAHALAEKIIEKTDV